MTVQILVPSGTGGLTIYAPPTSIKELSWESVSDLFKQEFLKAWDNSYKRELDYGNAGIDELSLLDDMAKRLNEGTLESSLTFTEAYEQEIQKTISSFNRERT